MDLYIEIRDGQPVNHPYAGENLRECGIDTDHLPAGYAPFVRVACTLVPAEGQTAVCRYVWDGQVVRDDWQLDGPVEQLTSLEN